MPMKAAHGNMYDWVTHVHTHLAGECPHKCVYCYVGKTKQGRPPRYTGEPALIESEFNVDYGRDKTIFIEHMTDLFAMPAEFITRVIGHCKQYPTNTYIFQTKDPKTASLYLDVLPPSCAMGITIESNRDHPSVSKAPRMEERFLYAELIRQTGLPVFITVEPILDFDVDILTSKLLAINPQFINIGADSKYCKLPEPDKKKVIKLLHNLRQGGMEIRKKFNLERILR